MKNSTIQTKTGPCLDCADGIEKYLTAGRCLYHYKKHRHEVNKSKNPTEIKATTIQGYKNKSLPQLLKIAERHFNAYIRKRDAQGDFFKCPTCGEYKPISKMDASHYMPAGTCAATRFNDLNVWGCCQKCNRFLHGNLGFYRKFLVGKIGENQVQILESLGRSSWKWDRFSIIHVIETYKQKYKEL